MRLFYFAPTANARLDREFGRQLDIPAVRNKVLGVCKAIRQTGIFVTVVSALAPQSPIRAFSKPRVYRSDGICVAQVFTLGRGVVRRVINSCTLLLFTMTTLKGDDRIIFYNFFPEYVPSALYLKLRGRAAILDIEDAPPFDETGSWRIVHLVCFALMRLLCTRKYLIVSESLAHRLGIENYLAVYGVADYFSNLGAVIPKFFRNEVNIHYGGNIIPSTGRNMFIDAVRELVETEPDLVAHFHVTGLFHSDLLKQFAQEINGRGQIKVSIYGELMKNDYRALMEIMDIGLSLKLPSTGMGQVTFPSKVVEISALGMLLCSTVMSDVPLLFDETSAILLKSENPRELAAKISFAIRHRAESRKKAQNGHAVSVERFSAAHVGAKVAKFLYE